MSDERLPGRLAQMREAATDALGYTKELRREEFMGDRRTQQAVLMNLFIIGEVATTILGKHAAFADAHPDIEWRNMRALRNRIGHAYADINLDVVWDTIVSALPKLVRDLDAIG